MATRDEVRLELSRAVGFAKASQTQLEKARLRLDELSEILPEPVDQPPLSHILSVDLELTFKDGEASWKTVPNAALYLLAWGPEAGGWMSVQPVGVNLLPQVDFKRIAMLGPRGMLSVVGRPGSIQRASVTVVAGGGDAPTLDSAVTSEDGTEVRLTFSTAMADPTGKHASFTFTRDAGGAENFSAAALSGAGSSIIVLTVSGTAIAFGEVIEVSYTAGTVTSAAAVSLASFSDSAVTNAVPDPMGAEPVFVWDPSDFADMTALEASEYYDSKTGTVSLESGTVPWLGGSGKFVRATYPGNGTSAQSNYGIRPPQQVEVWWEVYVRFNAAWHIESDDKTFFYLQNKPGVGNPVDRWDIYFRGDYYGSANNMDPDMSAEYDLLVANWPDLDTEVWDGNWHTLRAHYKIPINGATDGIYQVWLDGILICDASGFTTSNTPVGTTFSAVAFGANADPSGSGLRDWGQFSLWDEAPAWAV